MNTAEVFVIAGRVIDALARSKGKARLENMGKFRAITYVMDVDIVNHQRLLTPRRLYFAT